MSTLGDANAASEDAVGLMDWLADNPNAFTPVDHRKAITALCLVYDAAMAIVDAEYKELGEQ